MNQLLPFVTRYGPKAGPEGPVLFAIEVFGATLEPGRPNTLDPWQQDVLRAYGRGERRISIRACHGPGKTWLAALMVWHSLLCRFPQHTVATAPSKPQLHGALLKNVRAMYDRLPPELRALYDVHATEIRHKSAQADSLFEARTARAENPEALQGVHCAGGYVLLIADEASGVHEKIFEAAAGSMAGHNATTLLLSNPVRTSGFFFDTHHKLRDMWYTVHVGSKDSARVSADFIEDISRRYGEDSNAYRVRVLGEFPRADQDSIIPFEYIESARKRDIVVHPSFREIWALDVARYGDDQNVFMRRNALALLPDIQHWGGVDLMQTTGKVKVLWDETPENQRPTDILVDVIGLGSGVVDRLSELGLPVRGVNVAESSAMSDRYKNLGTELAFLARDWLASRDHALPSCPNGCANKCPHELLASEIGAWRYIVSSAGKYVREPKENVKKRVGKSPDFADAFFLSFAGEPASLIHGSQSNWGNKSWNEDISRELSWV